MCAIIKKFIVKPGLKFTLDFSPEASNFISSFIFELQALRVVLWVSGPNSSPDSELRTFNNIENSVYKKPSTKLFCSQKLLKVIFSFSYQYKPQGKLTG